MPHGPINLAPIATADLATLTVKRCAWAYGVARKGSNEEQLLHDRLVARIEIERRGPRCDGPEMTPIAAEPAPEVPLSAWPVDVVLAQLADAADHLLRAHDCDAQGHEGVRYAVVAARQHVAAMRSRPPPARDRGAEHFVLGQDAGGVP
jgi:hypothetical protein